MRFQLFALLFGGLFVMAGCPPPDQACDPGETQSCTCAGGLSGGQVCEEDGQGWDDCDCGAGDDDATGDDDTSSGDDDATGDDDVTGDDDATGDDDDSTGPGCAPCGGDYGIGNSSDLDDVYSCESITGNLSISGTDWLTSLDLPCLVSVDGSLDIQQNDLLISLDMPAFTTVGGTLNIFYNDVLSTLGGMSSLTTVGGSVNIAYNDCLSQVEAVTFAESLDVGGYIDVDFNGDNYPCP